MSMHVTLSRPNPPHEVVVRINRGKETDIKCMWDGSGVRIKKQVLRSNFYEFSVISSQVNLHKTIDFLEFLTEMTKHFHWLHTVLLGHHR